MNFLMLLLTLLGGAAVTLQAQFMGLMDHTLGSRGSVLITYAGGGLAAALLFLVSSGRGDWRQLWNVSLPWYVYTAGLIGLVIVGTIGYTVPRLGLPVALTLITLFQFMVAVAIDHFGWFGAAVHPLSWARLLGLVLMSAGVWLVMK